MAVDTGAAAERPARSVFAGGIATVVAALHRGSAIVLRDLTSPLATEPRFRAAQRKALRTAATMGAVTLAGMALIDAVRLALLYGESGRLVSIADGFAAVVFVAFAFAHLTRRRPARQHPEFLSAIAALVAIGSWLVQLLLIRESTPLMLVYYANLQLGIALFLPWRLTPHLLWLGTSFVIWSAFAVTALAPELADHERSQMVFAALASCAVSLVGHQVLHRRAVNAYRQQAEVRRLYRELSVVARIDAMTGAANRRALEEELRAIASERTRYGHSFTAVLFDLDHFKAYNDRYGHPAGDEVLRAIASTVKALLRDSDRLFRWGGEEFLAILPGQDPASGIRTAERIRLAIESLGIGHAESPSSSVVTASAGVAALRRDEGVDSWLERADAALYVAKRAGRNTVVAAAEERPPAAASRPVSVGARSD